MEKEQQNSELLNKYVKFAIEANEKNFIEIFGKKRGLLLYHNIFVAVHKKNMNLFLNSLEEEDKKLIYSYVL